MPKKPTGGSVTKSRSNPRPGPGAKNKALGRPTTTAKKPMVATMSKAGGAGVKSAKKYLAKSSGTTKGEVQGVLSQLRRGKISKGAAIKSLKGGPTKGVPAGNKKRVARAIKRAR